MSNSLNQIRKKFDDKETGWVGKHILFTLPDYIISEQLKLQIPEIVDTYFSAYLEVITYSASVDEARHLKSLNLLLDYAGVAMEDALPTDSEDYAKEYIDDFTMDCLLKESLFRYFKQNRMIGQVEIFTSDYNEESDCLTKRVEVLFRTTMIEKRFIIKFLREDVV